MSEEYYINQIYIKRQRLEEVEAELRKWSNKLNDLNIFLSKHTETVQQIENHFQSRCDKINNAHINSKEVKVFKQYKEGMLEKLNGNENRNIIAKKYDESRFIKEKIREVEIRINHIKQEIYSLEQSISNLNYELRRERSNND